jgi:hypothetical protein
MKLHFFEDYIKIIFSQGKIESTFPNDKGNVQMCCPFVHTKKEFDSNTWEEKEISYYEKQPSSSINMEKRCFNCFTCGRSYNELDFAQVILNKDKESIIREYAVKEELKNDSINWKEMQHRALLQDEKTLDKLYSLKITKEAIEELNLGLIMNCLATPVFKHESLVNIARYNINKIPNKPKVEYNKNANTGDIVPFDIWTKDSRDTIICEGEKDMIVARSQGLNAITLTGGAQMALQKEYLEYFKGRRVYICYDNDDVGRQGAIKRYKELEKYCDVYITDISSVCILNKEDVTDFFVKYNKNFNDFLDILKSKSRKPNKEELEKVKSKKELKLTKIEDNIKNSCFRKPLKSTLQIIATSTETYATPEYAIFTPKENVKDIESKSWFLSSSHENFLELIEGTVKTKEIPDIIASLLSLGNKWNQYYKVEIGTLQTIYKVTVADIALENDDKASEFVIDLYSKTPLDIGNIYEVEYKIYPHPKQGRRIIAIATTITKTNYDFDTENLSFIDSLNKFKATSNIDQKINELYESARCHIAPYLNRDIWFAMDLVFNSPLDITYKNVIRGALDIFVLGDTRTGKSETSKALKNLYDFGEIVPLKTATVASLIGGTDDKIKKTKLGVIPRHHKELIVMEEFSGAPMDFLKTLTEIRSSNMVKIYRVAGDLQTPCKLRMITISNPISENGQLMTLSAYPNGVEPINELIKSPEDIARYDMFILFPRVEKLSNPFGTTLNNNLKIDEKHYQIKSKWIKSLTHENIIISDEVGSYIFEKGIELNKIFECSFTVFGSETDKKIARMSAALACMLCSTNDFKHVTVTKEHVDYIVSFLIRIYDNPIFRLREFANEEKSYRVVVPIDTQDLESIYPKNVTFIDFLANTSKVNRNELMTVSGLDRDNFSKIFNMLVARKFIKLNRDFVAPTVKFRNTYRIMNKTFNLSDVKIEDNVNVF